MVRSEIKLALQTPFLWYEEYFYQGYDPENPCVRHGVEVNASSSTGYADGQYTDDLDETSDTTREWLSGGFLINGAYVGRFCAALRGALSHAYWIYAARLSASGRCAQSAA